MYYSDCNCLLDPMGFIKTYVLERYTDIFPKICHVQILSDISIIKSSVLMKRIYKNMFTRNIIIMSYEMMVKPRSIYYVAPNSDGNYS